MLSSLDVLLNTNVIAPVKKQEEEVIIVKAEPEVYYEAKTSMKDEGIQCRRSMMID